MRAPVKISILALEPKSRGLGYVMFKNESQAIDWGVHETRIAKNARCRAKAQKLVEEYKPELVVIEKTNDPCARRQSRIVRLIDQIISDIEKAGGTVERVARRKAIERFSGFGVGSKDDIAVAIASMLPELAHRLPKRRKAWESEHYSMAIFEAAALALTHYAEFSKLNSK